MPAWTWLDGYERLGVPRKFVSAPQICACQRSPAPCVCQASLCLPALAGACCDALGSLFSRPACCAPRPLRSQSTPCSAPYRPAPLIASCRRATAASTLPLCHLAVHLRTPSPFLLRAAAGATGHDAPGRRRARASAHTPLHSNYDAPPIRRHHARTCSFCDPARQRHSAPRAAQFQRTTARNNTLSSPRARPMRESPCCALYPRLVHMACLRTLRCL